MSATDNDYYSLLGVDPKADIETIRSAYRKLARECHPDVNDSPDAHREFKNITEAYNVLSDPKKKKQYDTLRAFSFGVPFEQLREKYANPATLNAMMKKVGTGLAAAAGLFKKSRAKKGRDLRIETEVSFFDSYNGTHVVLEYGRPANCRVCNGSGYSEIEPCVTCSGEGKIRSDLFPGISKHCPRCDGNGYKGVTDCPACEGTGRLQPNQEVKIKIPAGVNHNQRLRIKDMGEDGKGPGGHKNPGDLIVVVEVAPYPNLSRSGNDIHGVLDTPLVVAYHGGPVNIDLPHGTIAIQVPPLSWEGRALRVIGTGFADPGNQTRGDGFFTIRITPGDKDDEKNLHSMYIETIKGSESELPAELADKLKKAYGP